MKKMRRAWSLLLSTAILIGSVFFVNFSAFSSDTYSFTFEGVYDYTRAYEILELVNEERAAYGLDPLVLDKELQEAAMRRALETSVDFSHTRPDGRSCYTACPSKMDGENIAAGNSTAQATMEQWMNSAGHRANILREDFKSIGIGCFSYSEGESAYWSQCFGYGKAEGSPRVSGTQAVTESVSILKENVKMYAYAVKNVHNINYMTIGETGYFIYGILNPGWTARYAPGYAGDYTFSTTDPDVISIDSSGNFVAVGEGTATVTVSLNADSSQKYSAAIEVRKFDPTNSRDFKITYIGKYEYTTHPITPKPTVTYGDKTFVEGVDYTLSYKNNINPGTATMTVTLIGEYTGSVDLIFYITGDHTSHYYSSKVIKDATCEESGEIKYTCDVCGFSYTETIEKLPHTIVDIPAVAPTCTKAGSTAGKKCSVCGTVTVEPQEVKALGHSYGEWTTLKDATCTQNGTKQRTCSTCKKTEEAVIPALGHNYADGVCTNCNDDIRLTDSSFGILVFGEDENTLPEGAKLFVTQGTAEADGVVYSIEIQKNGANIQPNGRITVKVPVPDGMNGSELMVFRENANGTYTELNAEYQDGYMTFTAYQLGTIAVSTECPGTPAGMSGDVDADGEITDWDAIMLNRYLAGWDVTIDLTAADTDKDGEITDWDAILLNRYLAGWDVEL